MRTRHDPATDLADAQAALARSLEQRHSADPLRIAGERLIGLARDLLAELPATVPLALSTTERKELTQLAKQIYGACISLRSFAASTGTQVPTWLTRAPSTAEEVFFATLFARLPTLDYELRHRFFHEVADVPEESLRATYASWQQLNVRATERHKLIPVLKKASALTRAMAAIAELGEIS